jgi:hypothetical protein
MAEKFGANPRAAGDMSSELARVRSAMRGMGSTFDRYDDAVGSARVAEALDQFFSESSDNRESMDGLLKRASGMLRGLHDGTTSVDDGLAGALSGPDGGSPTSGGQR